MLPLSAGKEVPLVLNSLTSAAGAPLTSKNISTPTSLFSLPKGNLPVTEAPGLTRVSSSSSKCFIPYLKAKTEGPTPILNFVVGNENW
jgi:hypothetical protein